MAPSIGRIGMASGLDDRERDACLHRLGEHYAEGRLTADELDCRVQVALAAETPTDLEAAVADVPLAGEPEQSEEPGNSAPYAGAPVARRVAALVVLAAGGLLLAVAGPRSDLAEFSAGVAIALLGFVTHWWMGRGPAPQEAAQPQVVESPVLVTAIEDPEPAPATVIDLPVDEPVPTLPPRPLGRGNGTFPTQRTGD